jgi:hypothetical protein
MIWEKVQITPLKDDQSLQNPLNYFLVQFTPTIISIGPVYPLTRFVFFVSLHTSRALS